MKLAISIALVISSYLMGFVCIGLGYYPDLIYYTPFQLMLSFILLGLHHSSGIKSYLILCSIPFGVGLFIEIIGVNTGFPFGEYQYGAVLGWKIFETPILIGINWAILSYCFISIWQQLSSYKYISALGAALSMVALDFMIEPVAIQYKMWNWSAHDIPIQNYFAWGIVSFVIMYWMNIHQPKIINPLRHWVIMMILIFFIGLSLY